MCAGGATTTIYPTTTPRTSPFILADSGSRVVFAEDDEQVAKLREHRADAARASPQVVDLRRRPPTATG